MKAVILAGGFGKRLKPLTDSVPKPMIMVAGLPIIEWQIRWLSRHGVKEFVVCVGYLKELVTGHVGNGGRLGATVEYAVEEEPLGTGGALLNAKGLLVGQSGFFMLNGDVLTNLDPARLRDGGAANALALVPLQSPYGVVEVDGTSKVTRFVEKPKIPDRWINAGVYHFTNEVFSYLPDRGNIEVTALPAMAREGKLRAAKYDDVFWHSIDSHKDIEEAAKEMKTGP